MKLLDFTEYEPFNVLREKMDAKELGYFELFNPAVHLTGSERSELESPGLFLKPEGLRVLPDKTLAIKNSRVLAYVPDENWYRQRREYPTYHLARCSQFDAIMAEHPGQELLVTTRLSEDYNLLKIRSGAQITMVSHGFVVCKSCLHVLRYRDFDEFRNRRKGYSQKVLNEFRLEDFYRRYPQYPLSFGSRPVDEQPAAAPAAEEVLADQPLAD